MTALQRTAALALAVFWTRGRTVLHTWLIVALVAACLDTQISLVGGTRYALGTRSGDHRFPGVTDIIAYQAAFLEETTAALRKLSTPSR